MTNDAKQFFSTMTAAEQINFGAMYQRGELPPELAAAWREWCAAENARIQRKNADGLKKITSQMRTK